MPRTDSCFVKERNCSSVSFLLNQFDIMLVDGSNQIVNKSYYESKIRYLKKRIDRYAKKNPDLSIENIYIDQPEILENIKVSRNEIKRMKNILLQNNNSISFKNVAMCSEIKDNSEMFEYVKKFNFYFIPFIYF